MVTSLADPRARLLLAQALRGGGQPIVAPPVLPNDMMRRIALVQSLTGRPIQLAQAQAQPGIESEAGGGAPLADFEPFAGTGLSNQGLNRLVRQGTITPDVAAEIAAGAGNLDIPSELAARVGMARSFLDGYPVIREAVAGGRVTGPIDIATGRVFGRGEQGEVVRRIQTGVDALRRLLTGAAMTGAETTEYISRYEPSWFDDAESALKKLDGLKRDLEFVTQAVGLGRGINEMLAQKGIPEGLRDALQNSAAAQGSAPDNSDAENDAVPEGVDPEDWKYMTPEEKAAWRN